MKIYHISDTHRLPLDIVLPEDPSPGGVLVHSGDYSSRGTLEESIEFFKQVERHEHKFQAVIVVPGNHDIAAEEEGDDYEDIIRDATGISRNVHILMEDSVRIGGFNFYGMPIIPSIGKWAFGKERGSKDMQYTWDKVPKDTDILVSHGPPIGVLDTVYGEEVGCQDHWDALFKLPNLRANLFGHIHECNGVAMRHGILFSNNACLDESYNPYKARPYRLIEILKDS